MLKVPLPVRDGDTYPFSVFSIYFSLFFCARNPLQADIVSCVRLSVCASISACVHSVIEIEIPQEKNGRLVEERGGRAVTGHRKDIEAPFRVAPLCVIK